MAQFARPASTIAAGNWLPTGAATLHEATDETVANDLTDYAGVAEISTETLEVKLGAITDPSVSTGHTVFVRFRDDIGAYTWTFALYQGATVKASWNDTATASAFKDTSYTLTGPETDSLTDYADLRMRLSVQGGGLGVLCYVTQIYFQAPDATPPTPPFYDVFLWNRPDE